MHGRNIAVLVANSTGARLVRRDHDTGALKTCLTIEDGPSSRSINSRGSTEDERLRRQRVASFIEVIVAHLREIHAGRAFEGLVLAAPARMLADLTGGGHNTSVVSPPGKPGAYYWARTTEPDTPYVEPHVWVETAVKEDGSWWPCWIDWLKAHASGEMTAPPAMGGAAFEPIEPAPGRYVLET